MGRKSIYLYWYRWGVLNDCYNWPSIEGNDKVHIEISSDWLESVYKLICCRLNNVDKPMYERDVVKLTIKRWRETENIVYFCLHIRFLFIEWQKNSIIKQNVVIEDVTK